MVYAGKVFVRVVEKLFHYRVELIESVVFIDQFMLYFRPKAVYQRFYLQFEIIVFAGISDVSVYSVNRVAVFLVLGLRRNELETNGIFVGRTEHTAVKLGAKHFAQPFV